MINHFDNFMYILLNYNINIGYVHTYIYTLLSNIFNYYKRDKNFKIKFVLQIIINSCRDCTSPFLFYYVQTQNNNAYNNFIRRDIIFG